MSAASMLDSTFILSKFIGSENDQLAVFVDGECRGYINGRYVPFTDSYICLDFNPGAAQASKIDSPGITFNNFTTNPEDGDWT